MPGTHEAGRTAPLLDRHVLESVRKHQAGLQSFRSMRRIEARRGKASALRLRFSQSLGRPPAVVNVFRNGKEVHLNNVQISETRIMGGFAFRAIDRQLAFSHKRCAQGPRDGMKSIHECIFRRERDLETLVCAREPVPDIDSGRCDWWGSDRTFLTRISDHRRSADNNERMQIAVPHLRDAAKTVLPTR
jgi:hypothetical protein